MKKANINVNATRQTGELNHAWRYIGYDECNFTTMPEGRDVIGKFGSLADAPYYMRTHFMLCTGNCGGAYKWGSTNVCVMDGNGNIVYDWTVTDRIIDTYLENNCKPFFELGFMPYALSLANGMHEYKDRFSQHPPKDYVAWHDLIKALVEHCVAKYGETEVLTWYWELWNEPDIFYWRGTREEFFKLYDYTEAAVHAVLPTARLGAPSTTNPAVSSKAADFLDSFFEHCVSGRNYVTDKIGTRLDFITFHIKAGGYGFDLNAKKQPPSMKKYLADLRNGLEIVKKYNLQDKEVVLSEADPDGWAAGGRFDNNNMNYRNTEYFASFIAMSYNHFMMISKETGVDVRPLAWTFTFPGERCFEGTRAFTTQKINKAVFNLFVAYSKMGNRTLEMISNNESDNDVEVSGFASADDDGNMQILVYSHHDDWDIKEDFDVTVTINDVKAVNLENIKHYRIDANHSNAYTEWVKRGEPEYPEGDEYAAIKARDGLEIYTGEEASYKSVGDNVEMSFKMPAHGVSLIEINK